MTRTDVVVIGGGPAGLATAIACRLRGLDVVVLDKASPPIDRPCGEGIMPEGVEALSRLGLASVARRGLGFRGIRWIDRGVAAEGDFPGTAGLGVRRPALHEALVERAAAVGVGLEWRRPATGLGPGTVSTDDGPVAARWIVGADGRSSRVRRWAGIGVRLPGRRRIGVRRHVAVEPWTDAVEVYWGDGAEAYVTPVADDRVGVALMADGPAGSFEHRLEAFPELAARILGAEAVTAEAGAGPFGHRCLGVVSGRVALVGDASGTLDPITGEGLGLAFREAELLADAIAADEPARYAVGVRALKRAPALLNRLVLLLADRPGLRRRVVAALAADRELFGRLLGLRGSRGPVVRTGVAPLVWRMLRAAA